MNQSHFEVKFSLNDLTARSSSTVFPKPMNLSIGTMTITGHEVLEKVLGYLVQLAEGIISDHPKLEEFVSGVKDYLENTDPYLYRFTQIIGNKSIFFSVIVVDDILPNYITHCQHSAYFNAITEKFIPQEDDTRYFMVTDSDLTMNAGSLLNLTIPNVFSPGQINPLLKHVGGDVSGIADLINYFKNAGLDRVGYVLLQGGKVAFFLPVNTEVNWTQARAFGRELFQTRP